MIVMAVLFSVLFLALLLTFWRLLKGPDLSNRVVALDLMSILSVGVICAYAVWTDQPLLLDIAITLALVAFVVTLAFARYLERRRTL